MWLFNRKSLSEQSSLSYIIRRIDCQAKILKEIHNNYYELQEYDIHALSISTAADKNSVSIFWFTVYLRMPPQGLGADAFLRLSALMDMDITLSLLLYLVVRMINYIIIFLSHFPFPLNNFYSFEE